MQYSRNSSRSSDRELSLCREGAGLAKGSGVCYNPAVAEVAEWQTRRIQNPLPLKACGFKSRLRHCKGSLQSERLQAFLRLPPDVSGERSPPR